MPTLNWIGKQDAVHAADDIPYKVLEHDESLSYGQEDSDNLLIHGDNLESLKALLPYYKGKVKCIYIDPPYNTQNAFIHYNDKLEHTIWLSLIYPRLKLLKKFLSADGSIWISIDDDEGHYLKVICDEVFGRKNFVNNVIWEKKYSPQNNATWLSDSHDHILCYARSKDMWKLNLLPRTEEMNKRYKNPDNDPRGDWKSVDLTAQDPFEYGQYEIVSPSGKSFLPDNDRHWIYAKDKMQDMINDNRIWFGKKGENKPSLKTFLTEVRQGTVSKTIWFRSEVGDNEEAKREALRLEMSSVFKTPKPERLIERVLLLSTKEDDIVMDSFLGSGTTAAVAHKMKRRWIGIEMENTIYSHCVPRMKQVVDGEQGGISKVEGWKGGGGFKFYRLGSPIFSSDGQINPEVRFETLASHIWFSETGRPWTRRSKSPLIGATDKAAYYLLFNGILGDKSINGGNVLTMKLLAQIPEHCGRKIIYGEACRIDDNRLKALNIIFRQIPYSVKAR